MISVADRSVTSTASSAPVPSAAALFAVVAAAAGAAEEVELKRADIVRNAGKAVALDGELDARMAFTFPKRADTRGTRPAKEEI